MLKMSQRGSNCRLFSLAFATSLCVGDDPTTINYVQNGFRKHLIQCLEGGCISPFPAQRRKRTMKQKTVIKLNVPVYCTCRQPEGGRMIQCDQCNEWYHEECTSVPKEIIRKINNISWKCDTCCN